MIPFTAAISCAAERPVIFAAGSIRLAETGCLLRMIVGGSQHLQQPVHRGGVTLMGGGQRHLHQVVARNERRIVGLTEERGFRR